MIPAFINVYNTLAWPVQMAEDCVRLGLRPVFYDNASDYPLLLEYYATTKHQVIRAPCNGGSRGFFTTSGLVDGYYVHSDGDLDLSNVPDDLVPKLLACFEAHSGIGKIGLSLETSDLPDHFPDRGAVLDWEAKWWQHRIETPTPAFLAEIDTTFALYHTERKLIQSFYAGIRLDRPYTARHLPWYVDPLNLPEDYRYYLSTADGSTTWTQRMIEYLGNSRDTSVR